MSHKNIFHQDHADILISKNSEHNCYYVVLYMLCKHTKLKALITGLALHQLQTKSKVVDFLTPTKNQISKDIICSCK